MSVLSEDELKSIKLRNMVGKISRKDFNALLNHIYFLESELTKELYTGDEEAHFGPRPWRDYY